MGPKKGKKGKGKEDEKKDEMKFIDKEFYIIQIEDLNRKIARLESKCLDMEAENEAVRSNMEKLDQDRGDVISHLKRILQRKVDEVSELTERIDALLMAKETEGNLYKEKIKNMESDFKIMHEQLSSEIKLLNGKLNSLEEFRSQREDLMARFEKQELAIEEQEKRHDQQLLDLEQSYLIRKERLKEEMEARLLKLSLDFQKATQMRIASTTQSVIRENIAINNQLNTLVAEWKNMCDEIESLKIYNKNLIINENISKKDLEVVERKNIIQNEVIKKLSLSKVKLKERGSMLDHINVQLEHVQCELFEARRCERVAIENLGLAKQHLHALAVRYNELKVAQDKLQFHTFNLESILSKASRVVKQVLQLSRVGESEEGIIIKRAELMKTLEEILDFEASQKEATLENSLSVATLASSFVLKEKYRTGDLGIVPSKKDEIEISESVQETVQDATWLNESEDDIWNLKQEIIQKNELIEQLINLLSQSKSIVNEIKLLPVAKTRLMMDEVKERRNEYLDVLERLLDSNLLQTPRPLPLPSLESIKLDEGLIKDFDFPTDVEQFEEYPKSTKPFCEENNDQVFADLNL